MAGFGTFDIRGSLRDYGSMISAVDAIRTAKNRQTLYDNEIADRERALREKDELKAARTKAWGGDVSNLAALDPSEAVQIQNYYRGLSEERRARELEDAKRSTEQIGQIAAWVTAQPDPKAAWGTVIENLPPELRKSVPTEYKPGFVALALARATQMADLLDQIDQKRGQEAFNAGIEGLTAQPQTTAPNIETTPGAPVPGPQQGNTGPSERARYAFSKFVNAGVPPQVAAGLVGNFQQESGAELNPSAFNPQEGAFGIGQWRGDRRAALEQFAASKGTDPTDLDTQLEFALHELQGSEAAAGQHIFAAPDAATAAALVDQHYERSSGQHRNQRVSYAQALMDQGGAQTTMGPGLDPKIAGLYQLAGDPSLSDPQRQLVASLIETFQPAPQEPTNFQREFEYAQSQGFQGSPEEWKRSGGTTINNTIGAKEQARADSAATSSDVILNAADTVEALTSGMTTGLVGAAASYLPQSDAAELYRQVQVLRSNATVSSLNAMRQASPTGGALGNVTEKEGTMLADMAGALDPKSNRFPQQLDDYVRTLLRVVHGFQQGDQVFQAWKASKGAPEGAGAPPAPGMPGSSPAPAPAPSGPQGAPVQVQSVDQYNALPSGTQYVDPNGNVRTKR